MVTPPNAPRSVALLRERGYNLVFLICLVTLMSVLLTAMLPRFEQMVQREKEAELIFRGTQMAEGIRVFQLRHGRYPNTLEEMIELEPRSLRQLWKDPFAADGKWALILGSTAGGEVDEDALDPNAGRDVGSGSAPDTSFALPDAEFGSAQIQGPIVGVVSRAKKLALRKFMGKDVFAEWRFTATTLPQPTIVPGAQLVASANVENFGRPFPEGVEPQSGTGVDGDPANLNQAGGPADLFDDDDDGDDGR